MKTSNLIDILAQDQIVTPKRPAWIGLAVGGSLVFAFTLFLWFGFGMGVRADYTQAMTQLPVIFKQLLPLFLAVALYPFMKNALFPEGAVKGKMFFAVAVYAAFMLVLFLIAWTGMPAENHAMAIEGKSRLKCLVSIPLYSWIVMGAGFAYMRTMAPTNPQGAATLIALVSSGIAIAIYAFGCTEDSPLFYAIWYNVGLVISVVVGVFVGTKILKW